MNRYPIYICSKGRSATPLTINALERMGCDYNVIVEEQEEREYLSTIGPHGTVLVLPWEFKDNYRTLTQRDYGRSTGSGPARNYAWHHSNERGHNRHWIMDDNIRFFARRVNGYRIPCYTPEYFAAMEDFADRYKNLAMCGPQYTKFAIPTAKSKPVVFNTRIFSCNLILNRVPFEWRGRYNEDIILSIDMLKAGWGTVLFNGFLQEKVTTQRISGGNTEEIYGNGTDDKSRLLQSVHPDVVTVVERYGRTHHSADLRRFKRNRLVKVADPSPYIREYEFGMVGDAQLIERIRILNGKGQPTEPLD